MLVRQRCHNFIHRPCASDDSSCWRYHLIKYCNWVLVRKSASADLASHVYAICDVVAIVVHDPRRVPFMPKVRYFELDATDIDY